MLPKEHFGFLGGGGGGNLSHEDYYTNVVKSLIHICMENKSVVYFVAEWGSLVNQSE